MSKNGLMTNKEGRFFSGIIAEEIPVNGIWKQALKLTLPMLINGLDNKVGDKIPEPWQTHIEGLTTITYKIFQDKIVTKEEEELLIKKCSEIINTEIDLPFLEEEDEGIAYLFILQSIAALIRSGIKNKKE